MTKARTIADLGTGFVNISDTGTEGTKVASGTTAQRGSTAGQFRFNSTTGKFEGRNSSTFLSIDTSPVVSSINNTNVQPNAGGNATFVITGSGFESGATASFIGANASTVTASSTTVDNATQITAVAANSSFAAAGEPYDVKVTNTSGLAGQLDNQINVDSSPEWQTASGTLATINDNVSGTHATVSATDVDGDTVAYSLQSGSLGGINLNSSTGALSGDPTNVNSSTTLNFTLRATAGGKTADRAFAIVVNPSLARTILSSINFASGNASYSANSGLNVFLDPADTTSYSGSGSSVTNLAHTALSNTESGTNTFTITNMNFTSAGAGSYLTHTSDSTTDLRGGSNPSSAWSNDSNDAKAFCGWWYATDDLNNSSNKLWCMNDGDWGPAAQYGIRIQGNTFKQLQGSDGHGDNQGSTTLPTITTTNKWLFICCFGKSGTGAYKGIARAEDTNLTDVYNSSTFSYSTSANTPHPFTFGSRPDSRSDKNPSGTRMGFQAAWLNEDLSSQTLAQMKTFFEAVFDQTKSNY
ncbi:hypothetical protein OAS47_03820 [Pelagibacteraceae bacterium]|nr:hypothetical protein [Pelagibacteraceae bacterium]